MIKKYCIGDVHGCYFTLMALMDKIPKGSKIFFTGDLCDKGNFTKEVIQYIIDNNHTVIKGNHDKFMEEYLLLDMNGIEGKENVWSQKDIFGGAKTIKSYDGDVNLAKKHIEFISTLPFFLLEGDYFITHGFGLPYYKRRRKSKRQIMGNRINRVFKDWEDYENYSVINIFGHCDFDEVEFGKNYIGIDTGCVYGRKLTALELGSNIIIEQDVILKDIT